MPRSLQFFIASLPLLIAVGLFIIFSATSPNTIGPVGLLLTFVLLYLFWLSSFFVVLHFGIRLLGRAKQRIKKEHPKQWGIGVRRAYYVASIVAFVPVFLLGMQSLGQLNIRDILLVFGLVALTTFYVFKRDT